MKKPTTYKDAGVDVDAGLESLRRIKQAAASTHGPAVLIGLGSFGSLYDLGAALKDYKSPVLVQSADGVGTKMVVARMMGVYDTVGEDLVNHCSNDILCQGARGLTFLDYIAAQRLEPAVVEKLVEGMARACKKVGLALVGGETAEMPGVYLPGEVDLAGVITGLVEKEDIITGEKIRAGDALLGLRSSGLHTNGYTLARKVLFDTMGHKAQDVAPELGRTIGEALLEPHRDYSRLLLPLLRPYQVSGLAHITGGGLPDNTHRILSGKFDAVIEKSSWETPPLFQMIRHGGAVPEEEMFRAFNMGVGMVIAAPREKADGLAGALEDAGEAVFRLGEIRQGSGKVKLV
ncbi:MAG: phosphoribosylformylglycinamidine cyclo-ligase [Nitrospinota bacterium]|nr:phosphoribosylformylglycinamidine cyclo-ligase [Nitrospinota bacterium]